MQRMLRADLLRAHLEHGLQAHAQGNIESAKDAYEQALLVAPDDPQALNLLGAALLQLGHPEQAVAYLERSVRKQRHSSGVIGNLAQTYFALGRYKESCEAFRKASRLDPRNMQFQLGMATSLAMQRNFGEAETVLRRLAARFPNEALVWFNLGNVARDQMQPEQAIASYRKALEIDPRLIDARNNLGSVLQGLLRFEEAEQEYRKCVEMAPDYIIARCNLAAVMTAQGHFAAAEAACRQIISRVPQFSPGHGLLGSALSHQARIVEALQCHRIAAELAPNDSDAVATYAAALIESSRVTEGLRWYVRALALQPDSDSMREKLAFGLLGNGSLADGWREYRHRGAFLRFREKYSDVSLSQALPDDRHGKHICVLREQGLGDEIFFLRYARELHESGARVTYRANNKIRSLLSRSGFFDEVLEETAALPEADSVMLVGDLPHALSAYSVSALPRFGPPGNAIALRDCPWRVSIFWPPVAPTLALTPVEEKVTAVRKQLSEAGKPPYLGVTWRGGIPPREQRGANWTLYKEIGLQNLAETLSGFPGTLIALQRKPEPGELLTLSQALARPVHDFTALNEDLEGMLAVLALIDDYVGVSNTNMHLRAAVGKTARVLVPCPAEWRWMVAGRSSPWFPGFSIYRQSPHGDWRTALARLKADLEKAYS